MCGITGIFDTRDKRPVDKDLLARMNEVQFHRGPDAGGVHLEPGIGLAHRRLSIIDLASGQQPFSNENGTVVVVYNGEIYNFRELAKELTTAGYKFRTRCDTEVVLYAWEEWGEACVERLRGMFAFAIWDRNRSVFFLARDRLGIKPLHYSLLSDGRLIFASEIKSLLVHPRMSRNIDPKAVEEYFAFGYVPDPRTIFQGVSKLPPGHTLTVRRGNALSEPRCYWDIDFHDNGTRHEGDIEDGLIAHLREAVDIRMIADVPLGAFLSGGVDSSAVVSMMAQLSEKPVNTCSISFGDAAFDESDYARRVAQRYATDHQVEDVKPDDFSLVDRLAGIYDEPFADSSAMPTYRLCELARKRVTVALSGDGGDETFGGYRRYRWHLHEQRIRSCLPRIVRRPLFGSLGRIYPKIDWAPRVLRAKSTFQALARDAVEGYFHNFSIFPDDLRLQLYSKRFINDLDGYRAIEVFHKHSMNAPDHPLSMVQYLDFKTYLPGDILTKVDRASMAHSLEVRVPILDHKLVEWAAGLPPALKLRAGQGKRIFKRSLEPYLPKDLLYRKKMGFAVPLARWFRGPLRDHVRERLLHPSFEGSGFLNTRTVRRILEKHESGRRDFSAGIWTLLMFESFLRRIATEGE